MAIVNDAPIDGSPDRPIIPRHPRPKRRTTRFLLILVTGVLVVNALVGERGLLATLSANREHSQLSALITTLRGENAALREEMRLLRQEPRAIEELARRELGLIRPGEQLFIVAPGSAMDEAASPDTESSPERE